MHRRDEPVSAARKCLDESRSVGGVAQYLSQARDGVVEAVVKVNKGIGWPDLGVQLFAGHQIATASEQNLEYLQGLTLQTELNAVLLEFTSAYIQLKNVETQHTGGPSRGGHTYSSGLAKA